LEKEQPNNMLTQPVLNLAKSDEWKKVTAYRTNLVHEQPPSIKGLGITYKRKRRWVLSSTNNRETTFTLSIGSGNGAEHSVDEIMDFVQTATLSFVKLCDEVVSFYTDILSSYGME
jgi:hypothetical protein